jgi:hypothetical protein
LAILPLIVLFGEDHPDEADDRRSVGQDAEKAPR